MHRTKSLILMMFGSLLLIGSCTTYRYQQYETIDYVPPSTVSLENSRAYEVDFDTAWRAAVEVFAINNFQIKTMDRESGIIAAEAFFNPSDMIDMVIPGETVTVLIERRERMEPDGFAGSANPAYVRQYGRVTGVDEYEINRRSERSQYSVTSYLNLFLLPDERGDQELIVITVNTRFQTQERIGGEIPQPVSNGTLELRILRFLDERLQSR